MLRIFVAVALLWLAACGQPDPVSEPLSGPALIAAQVEGKPLRYRIGADDPVTGDDGEVVEVSYSTNEKPAHGLAIKYGNLFDETNSGKYGPYLYASDTAAQYNEGQIDPRGEGWTRNITEQIARAKAQGFEIIEWDNPDAYRVEDVVGAVDEAERAGLAVVAKNPLLIDGDASPYVGHRNVVGIIVEKGAGSPLEMDALRQKVKRPSLQVWFVFFGAGGLQPALKTAGQIVDNDLRNMGVTHSTAGEYGNSVDVLRPR